MPSRKPKEATGREGHSVEVEAGGDLEEEEILTKSIGSPKTIPLLAELFFIFFLFSGRYFETHPVRRQIFLCFPDLRRSSRPKRLCPVWLKRGQREYICPAHPLQTQQYRLRQPVLLLFEHCDAVPNRWPLPDRHCQISPR